MRPDHWTQLITVALGGHSPSCAKESPLVKRLEQRRIHLVKEGGDVGRVVCKIFGSMLERAAHPAPGSMLERAAHPAPSLQ